MSATNAVPVAPSPQVRLAYLGQLVLVVLAVAAAMLAAGSGAWRYVLVAALAGGCAWLVRSRLAASGALAACAAEDDAPVSRFACDKLDVAHEAARRRWRELEARRGTPDFDPWEYLTARREFEAAESGRD